MSVLLALTLAQSAEAGTPVAADAPPEMLRTGYDQCLNKEVEGRLASDSAPAEIFEASHLRCAFWLDAYFEKVRQGVILTNIDLHQQKLSAIEQLRSVAIPQIAKRKTDVRQSRADSARSNK
ncbi:hypothetical protein [Qipengyuania sediminis]|uniref:hypothetical protein n=1 Tax=Qipengyuania sediminis TaxID=1532023 RepID=UPI00105A0519|nr:hypothetical protein [Qipengyuania sediminis]